MKQYKHTAIIKLEGLWWSDSISGGVIALVVNVDVV